MLLAFSIMRGCNCSRDHTFLFFKAVVAKERFLVAALGVFLTTMYDLHAQTNVFPSSGNVGIGTTSPVSALEVAPSYINSSIKTGAVEMQSFSINNNWLADNVYFDGGTFRLRGSGFGEMIYFVNGSIKFNSISTPGSAGAAISPVTRMIIQSNGNVGIGTGAAASTLSVVGSDQNGLSIASSNAAIGSSPSLEFNFNSGSGGNSYNIARIVAYSEAGGGGDLQFQTAPSATAAYTTKMTVLQNGNVGIGVANPSTALEISPNSSNSALKAGSIEIESYSVNNDWIADNVYFDGGDFRFRANGNAEMIWFSGGNIYFTTSAYGTSGSTFQPSRVMMIGENGYVGIGTTNPSYQLSVNGTVQAKEVIVQTGWSDYVFAPEYRLATLKELEKQIKKEGHLPGIPSAKDVAEHGVKTGEMESKLLEKVEELTLHLIDMNKREDEQAQRIDRLESENAALRSGLR